MKIEQALFAAAPADGCGVLAASRGVIEADRRELEVWGPTPDSLLDVAEKGETLSFHPLPSGAFCVARTLNAGWAYGERGSRAGAQCLIVPPGVLARFANDPFALVRTARAAGLLDLPEHVGDVLKPLELHGRAPAVDEGVLVRLAARIGPPRMAALVQAALDGACLAVGGDVHAEQLIAGLLHCLPVECRTECSFSTGMRFSPRRPFHVLALPANATERRWLAEQANIVLIEISETVPPSRVPLDGWARLVERVLAARQTAFLATQLAIRRRDLTTADLPALGLQLLEELDASLRSADGGRPLGHRPPVQGVGAQKDDTGAEPQIAAAGPRRAHAAHRQFEKSLPSGDAEHAGGALPRRAREPAGSARPVEHRGAVGPARSLCSDSPEVVALLETLDDAVFMAIAGQQDALERLQAIWPQVRARLGDDLLAESREQYLRYALAIWQECIEAGDVRDPARAVQAVEVLCLLFDEV